jgi:hypothetical protein
MRRAGFHKWGIPKWLVYNGTSWFIMVGLKWFIMVDLNWMI